MKKPLKPIQKNLLEGTQGPSLASGKLPEIRGGAQGQPHTTTVASLEVKPRGGTGTESVKSQIQQGGTSGGSSNGK
jgi:hypothetical protein